MKLNRTSKHTKKNSEFNTSALNYKNSRFYLEKPSIIAIVVGIFIALCILDGIVIALFILFFVIIIFLYFTNKPKIEISEVQAKRFANDNKLNFTIGGELNDLPPLISIGIDDAGIAYTWQGRRCDTKFKLMYLNTSIRVTEDFDSFKYYLVIMAEIDGSLPGFVVDAVYNELPIKKHFTDYSKLNLEGDFSNYFHVYSPKGDHINVMSVLSPDIMDSLLKNSASVADLIVSSNKVWLITPLKVNSIRNQTTDLIDVYDTIIPELNHRAKSYK